MLVALPIGGMTTFNNNRFKRYRFHTHRLNKQMTAGVEQQQGLKQWIK